MKILSTLTKTNKYKTDYEKSDILSLIIES